VLLVLRRLTISTIAALALVSAGLAALASPAAAYKGTASQIPAFYDPPSPLPAGQPGDIIRQEEIKAPNGARAWKVMYLSKLVNGDPVAVTGLVIAPDAPAPTGGRPIVAWAHGTTGAARQCAPSLPPDPARPLLTYFDSRSSFTHDIGVPALNRFLAAGDVIASTDYQGLGTPGVHQYVVAQEEARNVLDSAKAAKNLMASGAGRDTVILGWSQGGGAAMYAAQDTAYAAPLNLLGVAGLAPAADTGPQLAGKVFPGPFDTTSESHSAAERVILYRGFAAAYPELDLSDVLTPLGMTYLTNAKNQCIYQLWDSIQQGVRDPSTLFAKTGSAAWKKRLQQNTPGFVAPQVPILVMQGTADTVVNPHSTTDFVKRECQFATQPVQYSEYQGATHQTIPVVALSEYVKWIADRFAGKPAPSNCPT